MSQYNFTGNFNYSETPSAINYIDNTTIVGANPSSGVPLSSVTDCANPSIYVSTDGYCSPSTMYRSCTINNQAGTCIPTLSQNNDHCIFTCVKDITPPISNNSHVVSRLNHYWNTTPEVASISDVDMSDNYWTIAPSQPLDICGPMCQDTNPSCLQPTGNPTQFCDPNLYTFHTECCVCNPDKWDRNHKFIGTTSSTPGYPIHNSYDINANIPSDLQNDIGTTLEFKRIEQGKKRPFTNNSDHLCYVPVSPSNNIYSYNDNTNMDEYAFYIPMYATNMDSRINHSIGTIDNPDPNRFFPSNTDSILGKTGYYEQCLYGNINNDVCPSSCQPDMSFNTTSNPSYPICNRCPPGEGLAFPDAISCSSCDEINQLEHPRGYGCAPCPSGQYYHSNECHPCDQNNHKIITACENRGTQQCPSPEIRRDNEDKELFYNRCLSDPTRCQIKEYCSEYTPSSDTISSSQLATPSKYIFYDVPGNLDNSHQLMRFTHTINEYLDNIHELSQIDTRYNLYMNEVCKTINNRDHCNNSVPECKWYPTNECLLDLPTASPSNIKIPMALPKSMNDVSIFNQQNQFATPSQSGNTQCTQLIDDASAGQTETYHEHQFWTPDYARIYPGDSSCSNVSDIQIPNIYTNLPVNMYSSRSIPEENCLHYGCVSEDKYIQASLYDHIYPLCQQLVDASSYYNHYFVYHIPNINDRTSQYNPLNTQEKDYYSNYTPDKSINNMYANPSHYGCLLSV